VSLVISISKKMSPQFDTVLKKLHAEAVELVSSQPSLTQCELKAILVLRRQEIISGK
jgi:hypothetical protein